MRLVSFRRGLRGTNLRKPDHTDTHNRTWSPSNATLNLTRLSVDESVRSIHSLNRHVLPDFLSG